MIISVLRTRRWRVQSSGRPLASLCSSRSTRPHVIHSCGLRSTEGSALPRSAAVENQRTLLIRTVEFYSFHFRVFNRYNLNHNHENSSSAALGRGDARVQLVPQVGQPRGQPCRRRLRGCRAPYVGASSSWRVASSRSRVCARRSCFHILLISGRCYYLCTYYRRSARRAVD